MKNLAPKLTWLVVLLALGCGQGKDKEKGAADDKGATKDKDSNGKADSSGKKPDGGDKGTAKGKPFTSAKGGFSITFPASASAPKESENDGTVLVNSKLPDQTVLQIVSVKLPDAVLKAATAEQQLDNVRNGMVQDRFKGGKVITDKKIKLDDHPGRDLQIEIAKNNSLYRERMFRAGDRLYRIIVLGPKATVASADVDRFFDSFKFAGNEKHP